jgi:hypothetical protein
MTARAMGEFQNKHFLITSLERLHYTNLLSGGVETSGFIKREHLLPICPDDVFHTLILEIWQT